MPLYTEIDWVNHLGGRITAIQPGSVADEVGILPGDVLLAINDNKVDDVIDVHFYAAEEYLELLIRRDGEYLLFEAMRDYEQHLGLDFEHPTFDTDIRRCNNLCEFCFVLQMAPRYRRTLYIKDDDYRYSFLFGHFVTLTNLEEHDWWRIETMRLSPLYISVHVTDLEMRRRFLRNRNAPDILAQLAWLAERGIEYHTQLVIVPGFNDGDWLDRSVRDLAKLWPSIKSISVVPVGLTKHHKYGMRTHQPEEAGQMLNYLERLQPDFKEQFGLRFVYPTDEWYLLAARQVPPLADYDGQTLQENGLGMVRNFLDEWEHVRGEIASWSNNKENGTALRLLPFSALTMVTGTMFAPILDKKAAELSAILQIQIAVVPVINERLGHTITTAGLLMAEDIVNQLSGCEIGDLIVLPRIVFDHPAQISLDDLSPQDIANRLGRPVALADAMGDVWDALIGQSNMFYRPEKN